MALEDVSGLPAWAIVLAAGGGRRMGAPGAQRAKAKQFETIGSQRLVDRTVAAARRTCRGVVVVLPPGRTWDGAPVEAAVAGGDHQSDSLRAGLARVPLDADIVVVADPAHPLASDALFDAVIAAVAGGAHGAVPVLPAVDVVQRVDGGRVVATVAGADLVSTQAPQAFRARTLRALHADRPTPVDNSSLLVGRGLRVDAVPGEATNIHVTTADDLTLVRRIVDRDHRQGTARATVSGTDLVTTEGQHT